MAHSVQRDRLTFFGVLVAVVVVVIGYLQLGQVYDTTGRADASPGAGVEAQPVVEPEVEPLVAPAVESVGAGIVERD